MNNSTVVEQKCPGDRFLYGLAGDFNNNKIIENIDPLCSLDTSNIQKIHGKCENGFNSAKTYSKQNGIVGMELMCDKGPERIGNTDGIQSTVSCFDKTQKAASIKYNKNSNGINNLMLNCKSINGKTDEDSYCSKCKKCKKCEKCEKYKKCEKCEKCEKCKKCNKSENSDKSDDSDDSDKSDNSDKSVKNTEDEDYLFKIGSFTMTISNMIIILLILIILVIVISFFYYRKNKKQ